MFKILFNVRRDVIGFLRGIFADPFGSNEDAHPRVEYYGTGSPSPSRDAGSDEALSSELPCMYSDHSISLADGSAENFSLNRDLGLDLANRNDLQDDMFRE
jgi:hypothetical protein